MGLLTNPRRQFSPWNAVLQRQHHQNLAIRVNTLRVQRTRNVTTVIATPFAIVTTVTWSATVDVYRFYPRAH